MKKVILSFVLSALFLCGCGSTIEENAPVEEPTVSIEEKVEISEEKTVEALEEKEAEEQIVEKPAPEIETVEPIHEPKQEVLEESNQETEEPIIVEHEEIIKEEQIVSEKSNTISLFIDCSDILNDLDSLKEEKQSLVPDNGIIFAMSDVEFTEGESVFDVLKRTLTSQGIHLEFNLTPVTNSAYIEGIGNIYEFDCGERSGWKYSVNGEFPRVGCSDFRVKSGDKIVFVYKIKAY